MCIQVCMKLITSNYKQTFTATLGVPGIMYLYLEV